MYLSKSPKTQGILAQGRRYLVTGVAGFIGSNMAQALLESGNEVVGLDDFSCGRRSNLEEVKRLVGPAWERFKLIEGDIRDLETCRRACDGIDAVHHMAARGSVPSSIMDPLTTNEVNVNGSLNVMVAAREAGVRRFIFSSSCSVYGDQPDPVKIEDAIGRQLSPYAVSKRVVELYSQTFASIYGFPAVVLRYFNVYGPRQDPANPLAAVIPIWISAMIQGKSVRINGKGDTSRDYCYVKDVVQANVLASSTDPALDGEVLNVCAGNRTSLNELYELIRSRLAPGFPSLGDSRPEHGDYRAGDILHSTGSTEKAVHLLGYTPTYGLAEGLDEALPWFLAELAAGAVRA